MLRSTAPVIRTIPAANPIQLRRRVRANSSPVVGCMVAKISRRLELRLDTRSPGPLPAEGAVDPGQGGRRGDTQPRAGDRNTSTKINTTSASRAKANHKIIFDDRLRLLVPSRPTVGNLSCAKPSSYDLTSIMTLCAVGSEVNVSKALP